MTSQQILQADLLDILFEKRNKAYGAYQLRRNYQQQLVKAVTISIATAFLLLYFFKPSFDKNVTIAAKDDVLVRVVTLPDKEKKTEPPKTQEAPKTQAKQQNFTDRFQMKEVVTDPLPPIDAMEKAVISNITMPGGDATAIQPPSIPAKTATETPAPANEQKEDVVPDRQPQFPGGMQAWLSFLTQNLRSPEELESGEKRTVLIRFHVAEDGSVANFQVVQSAGAPFDNEVIRVLKKMPRWTPALFAGQPVAVSFTQPVTFVGVEE
ncbi:energy transducer TonB [Flavisolibacter nicotianae]|uniref:energy transducer TonB n=1 Tax=Flavisolibacter nicotianae TaxID=2364882 RepID=UPI0013C48939|nr:energy transducer TonB [Flavisolibacter nicotianae]